MGIEWSKFDRPRRGKLWVIEGGDGAGKSTQIGMLKEKLEKGNCRCLVTRQPTDWYRNQPLTRRFLNEGGTLPEARVLALFAAADRLLHCSSVIEPALKDYDYVLCDRYVYSSLVYFEHRGVNSDFVLTINAGIPAPDGAIFLDVPPRMVDRRLLHRDGTKRKFEERGVGTIGQIRNGFLGLSSMLRIVDATGSAEEVLDRAYGALLSGLPHSN